MYTSLFQTFHAYASMKTLSWPSIDRILTADYTYSCCYSSVWSFRLSLLTFIALAAITVQLRFILGEHFLMACSSVRIAEGRC